MPQPFYLLSFNQIRCGKKREKAQNSLSFLFKFQMENALFAKSAPAVTCGIAVLGFFSCGISVILILTCGIAVSSSSAVCGLSFWLTVFGEIRLFTVLRYRYLRFPFDTIRKTKHSRT